MTGRANDGPGAVPAQDAERVESGEGGPQSRRDLVLIILGLAGVLAAFSGKAFHIDDPVYVWVARQIHESPFDFYGFKLNWHLSPEPVYDWNRNPPLVSYLIALVALVVGWSERALHLAFIIPALALAGGGWRLARLFGASPTAAVLVLVLSPVFLVSSTGVMADVTMAAFYVWAVALWFEGTERRNWKRLAAAAALLALACLAKYTAITAVPLLAAFTLMRRTAPYASLLFLVVPLAALAVYHVYTLNVYGKGLLIDAAAFSAGQSAPESDASYLTKALVGLAFLGGGLLPALAAAAWSRRTLAILAAVFVAAGSLLLATGRLDTTRIVISNYGRWLYLAQAALFVTAGLYILALAARGAVVRRDAPAAALLLWVAGIFVFMTFLNWTINARTLLPAAPAVAVLAGRVWHERTGRRRTSMIAPAIALVASGLAGVSVAWGDYRHAAAGRDAALEIRERTADTGANVVFQGHWGFQYYMEEAGFRPFAVGDMGFRPGDVIVVPSNSPSTTDLPDIAKPFMTIEVPAARWISVMNREARAGFYSHYWGPLPYVFGPAPPERFALYEVQAP